MSICRALLSILVGVCFPLVICGCSSEDNSTAEIPVTVQGQVDDGTATSPIANAACSFVHRRGRRLGTVTADTSGRFQLLIPPETEGFISCNPPGFPKLILTTFISTVGVAPGATLPAQGLEKVAPETTVVANIIAQTQPPDPQARKVKLFNARRSSNPATISTLTPRRPASSTSQLIAEHIAEIGQGTHAAVIEIRSAKGWAVSFEKVCV